MSILKPLALASLLCLFLAPLAAAQTAPPSPPPKLGAWDSFWSGTGGAIVEKICGGLAAIGNTATGGAAGRLGQDAADALDGKPARPTGERVSDALECIQTVLDLRKIAAPKPPKIVPSPKPRLQAVPSIDPPPRDLSRYERASIYDYDGLSRLVREEPSPVEDLVGTPRPIELPPIDVAPPVTPSGPQAPFILVDPIRDPVDAADPAAPARNYTYSGPQASELLVDPIREPPAAISEERAHYDDRATSAQSLEDASRGQ